LNIEALFDDHLVVVAGMRSRWPAVARSISPSWSTSLGFWRHQYRALQDRVGGIPSAWIKYAQDQLDDHVRASSGQYGRFRPFHHDIPTSVVRLHADRFSLKVLPVDLPDRPWPVAIVTLKIGH